MSDGKLRKVGALWKPREGAKSKGSGSVTINGMRQRFVVLVNDHKTPGSKEPDYSLMSSDEPEVDEYAAQNRNRTGDEKPAASAGGGDFQVSDDDVPF